MGSAASNRKSSNKSDSSINMSEGEDSGGGGDGFRGGTKGTRLARKDSLADASLALPRPTPFASFTMETSAAIVDGIPEDRRIVLLGESTHGTEEFYHTRAEITKRLIEERVGVSSCGRSATTAARASASGNENEHAAAANDDDDDSVPLACSYRFSLFYFPSGLHGCVF